MVYKEYLDQLAFGLRTNLSLAMTKEGSILYPSEWEKVFSGIEKDLKKIVEKSGLRLDLAETKPLKCEEGSVTFFIQDGIKRIKIAIALVSGDKSPHFRVTQIKHGNSR